MIFQLEIILQDRLIHTTVVADKFSAMSTGYYQFYNMKNMVHVTVATYPINRTIIKSIG